MTIIHGVDSSSVVHPLLLDANGNVIISAEQLTTTGGKIHVDASGNIYCLSYPHDVFSIPNIVQVTASQTAVNNTKTLFTVAANHITYITNLTMLTSNQTAAAGTTWIEFWDATPALSFTIVHGAIANSLASFSAPFSTPIRFPAGWSLRVRSATVNIFAILSCIGYDLS